MNIIRNQSKSIAGRPVTSQRSVLLEIIRKAGKHLDADELFRLAKKKEPRISLATVYRNLKLFKELGLIADSGLGDTHSHYEIKGKADHYHLVCLGCGKIIEFDNQLITEAVSQVQKKTGYNVTSTQMKIEGYCPECQQKKK